jgi:RNA polymerase sigma-70 factor (ECF subfamily)
MTDRSKAAERGTAHSPEIDQPDPIDLIEAEVPRLRRYARYLAADTERGDDLVQDTLARSLEKLHLWQPGTNMRAWLFTIMHNLHVSNVRRAQRRPTSCEVTPENPGPPTVGNQFDNVRLRELSDALEKISDEHREVLLLVVVEGMAYQDAAEVLDVAVGTVRSRLSRAREALREALEQVDPEAAEKAFLDPSNEANLIFSK